MKKNLLKIYLLVASIFLSIEKTYALSLSSDMTSILYIVCGLFICFGFILIVIGRVSAKKIATVAEDENKNEIAGLVDKDKISKSFNPDSIFKEIPTFSNKKFFEKTYEELERKITSDSYDIKSINLVRQEITDFQDKNDKYVITSEFTIEYKILGNLDKESKIYTIISENRKDSTTNAPTVCPNCGGKIKDLAKERCPYCSYKFEEENHDEVNKNNWIITDIKENTNHTEIEEK